MTKQMPIMSEMKHHQSCQPGSVTIAASTLQAATVAQRPHSTPCPHCPQQCMAAAAHCIQTLWNPAWPAPVAATLPLCRPHEQYQDCSTASWCTLSTSFPHAPCCLRSRCWALSRQFCRPSLSGQLLALICCPQTVTLQTAICPFVYNESPDLRPSCWAATRQAHPFRPPF